MIRFFSVFHWLLLSASSISYANDAPALQQNRLAKAASPYLRQHATNPVDWYPWGPDAFAKAKAESKFIFLSIGYSACHWCHVMERESFANPQTAAILNEHFVCIKVDREERPDIDEVYMAVFQVLRMPGGWPLSMFLTDEGKPIFGGTYWPKEDREVEGETIPGFPTILRRVIDLKSKDTPGLLKQADEVARRTAVELESKPDPEIKLTKSLVDDALASFEFDPQYGGFAQKARGYRGSKFPRPTALLFLLEHSQDKSRDSEVELTLRKMATGGLYDQLGGGFHRYSTERTWTVPHFEKMLYDNAMLLSVYAKYRTKTKSREFDHILHETVGFVRRELTSTDGLFYSALDADTEGKEGRFYVWTKKELDEALGTSPEAQKLRKIYSFDSKPNFEDNFYIPTLVQSLTEEQRLDPSLNEWKQKLFAIRAKREKPFLDTKVLAGWNGLMIAGLADAGAALNEPSYTKLAEQAADNLLNKLRTKDGELIRMYAAVPGEQPTAYGPTFADDYAGVIHGLLTLHRHTHGASRLQQAEALFEQFRNDYASPTGGYYLTSDRSEKLFARGKDYYDGALPSANGLMAKNLARLWLVTGKPIYEEELKKSLANAASSLNNLPDSVAASAHALADYLAVTKSNLP